MDDYRDITESDRLSDTNSLDTQNDAATFEMSDYIEEDAEGEFLEEDSLMDNLDVDSSIDSDIEIDDCGDAENFDYAEISDDENYDINIKDIPEDNAVAQADIIPENDSSLELDLDEENDMVSDSVSDIEEQQSDISCSDIVEEDTDLQVDSGDVPVSTDNIIGSIEVEGNELGENAPLPQGTDMQELENNTSESAEISPDNVDVRDKVIQHPKGLLRASIGMNDSLKAYDKDFSTLAGYRMARGSNFAYDVAAGLAHLPETQKIYDKNDLTTFAHAYDDLRAAEHPGEVIDFSPKPIDEELKERNTLILDSSDLYEEAAADVQSDAAKYKQIIDRTPINNGEWRTNEGNEGQRGESRWCPNFPEVTEQLSKYGVDGIEYNNGYPDFSPVSRVAFYLDKNDVTNSDNEQFNDCNYWLDEVYQEDKELQDFYNFDEYQLEEIENGNTPYGYTWHHDAREDGLMMLVPTSIHQACRHSGGRSSWGGGSKNR